MEIPVSETKLPTVLGLFVKFKVLVVQKKKGGEHFKMYLNWSKPHYGYLDFNMAHILFA